MAKQPALKLLGCAYDYVGPKRLPYTRSTGRKARENADEILWKTN